MGAWLSWFFIMGYLKMFVGLAGDRCESLLSSPSSTPLQHLRCLALLLGILMHTAGWMADYVARAGLGEHAQLTSAALWLFDGVTVVVEAACGIVKYGEWAAGAGAGLGGCCVLCLQSPLLGRRGSLLATGGMLRVGRACGWRGWGGPAEWGGPVC